MDGQRARDLLTLLQERVVFLTGGRDRRGGPLLCFPATPRRDRLKPEDLRRLLSYLISIPRWVRRRTRRGGRGRGANLHRLAIVDFFHVKCLFIARSLRRLLRSRCRHNALPLCVSWRRCWRRRQLRFCIVSFRLRSWLCRLTRAAAAAAVAFHLIFQFSNVLWIIQTKATTAAAAAAAATVAARSRSRDDNGDPSNTHIVVLVVAVVVAARLTLNGAKQQQKERVKEKKREGERGTERAWASVLERVRETEWESRQSQGKATTTQIA